MKEPKKITAGLETLNILEFISRLELLAPSDLSFAQRTCLKSIYGLPLTDDELTLYLRATGRSSYEGQEQSEGTIICGRRGGKTGYIAAPIALFESFRSHGIPKGEHAYVVFIAPVKRQAHIAFTFVKNYLRRSPLLRAHVVKIRKDEIELKNGATIACWPCSHIAVRGATVLCAICDELAFWPH